QVSQHFEGLIAVNEVSLHADKGEIVGIIGPNGAGKTTLFNAITGLTTPTKGKIYYRDTDITEKKPYEITALGLARTFQNIRLCSGMTVLDNVMVGVHCHLKSNVLDQILHTGRHRADEKKAYARAAEVLALTGLDDYRYEYATSLPYGIQRRVEIARAIATQPELLLFDEPAAGMNEQETSELMDFILKVRDMGYTILLIEHDMRLVMNICDRIHVLDHGALIAEGIPSEIRSNPDVITAYLGKEA
ncbi:MAG: ABC transporter ATP-binding protein, partial [Clostridia bacterium]|nr:ABC transporter ATP-binding protein [Clostridia bacterium]